MIQPFIILELQMISIIIINILNKLKYLLHLINMIESLLNIFLFIVNVAACAAIMDAIYVIVIEQNWTYDDVEDVVTKSCWEFLRIYGKLNIFYNNHIMPPFKNWIYTPIHNMIDLFRADEIRIVFVKDGNEIASYQNKSMIYKSPDYDFILFHLNSKRTMILNDLNDIPEGNDVDVCCVHTSVSFMCCQISFTLKNDEIIKKSFEINDFCLNLNKVFEVPFVNWYCKKYFKNDFDINDIKSYKINLLDNDVNELTLEYGDFILIRSNSYVVNKKNKDQFVMMLDMPSVKIEKTTNEALDLTNNENETDEDIEKIENEIENDTNELEPTESPLDYGILGWSFPII